MNRPGDYFSDPREADLVNRVWDLSASLPGSGWSLHSTHQVMADSTLPWVNRRIIYARDWITAKRESDAEGGVVTVNQALGTTVSPRFTAVEIGNVEHFYVAALTGTLGGPVGGVALNILSGVLWELVVGPARIAWVTKSPPATLRNLWHNLKQLLGPDAAGTRFGSFYPMRDLIEEVMRRTPDLVTAPTAPPAAPPPAAPPPPGSPPPVTVTVGPDDWLSKISGRLYKDVLLWPIIYEANRAAVGPNPNVLSVGKTLVIPDIRGFTQAQLAETRKRGRDWRTYK